MIRLSDVYVVSDAGDVAKLEWQCPACGCPKGGYSLVKLYRLAELHQAECVAAKGQRPWVVST